jgi:hypothetical protein
LVILLGGLFLDRKTRADSSANLNKDQQIIENHALNNSMEKKTKLNGHGGARPGAGRKPGSGNKVRLEDLMMDIETETNMRYTQRLAINYSAAIDRSDWARVENYDRAFLNKLVGDRQSIEITDSAEAVEAKRVAFAEALSALAQVGAK